MAITSSKVHRAVQAGRWSQFSHFFQQKMAEQNIDTASYAVENGLQVAPIKAAVDVRANAVGSAEIIVERVSSAGEWSRVTDDLPAWANIRRRPNQWQTAYTFLSHFNSNRDVSGNGFIRIMDRAWKGYPNHIVSVPSRDVSVNVGGVPIDSVRTFNDSRAIPGYGGAYEDVTYIIDSSSPLSAYTSLDTSGEVLHSKLWTLDDVVFGVSPLMVAAPPIRTAVAADAYAELAFKMGMLPPGVFSNRGKVDEADVNRTRKYVQDILKNPANRHGPLFTSGDWEFVSTYINPNDLQLMPARQYSFNIASAIYRVPVELMGSPSADASGSAIRNIQRAFTMMTIVPLLNEIGGELSQLVPDDYRVRLIPQNLLELDQLEESRVDDRLIRAGVMLPSEARAKRGWTSEPMMTAYDEMIQETLLGGYADEGGQSDSGKDSGTENERPTNSEE